MKLSSYLAAIGVFCIACTPTFSQVINALSTAPKDLNGEFVVSKKLIEIPIDKARKKIIENIEKKSVFFQQNSTVKAEQLTDIQFVDYFSQLEILYKNELKGIENSTLSSYAKVLKKSDLEKSFSVALSGQCMNEKNSKQYILSKDADGLEIAFVWDDAIRANPRYSLIDDYQQGFARIKKDGVFGFWDLCGNEKIPPQYDFADRFNDGKALVKKFNWHFVNVKGEESVALDNIVDAKAVKFGVSIVKYTNEKMGLINNNFDVSKEPISEEFDEISLLNNEYLLVREGRKYGIVSIEGKTVANLIYDKIWMERKGEFMMERNKKVTKKNSITRPEFGFKINFILLS